MAEYHFDFLRNSLGLQSDNHRGEELGQDTGISCLPKEAKLMIAPGGAQLMQGSFYGEVDSERTSVNCPSKRPQWTLTLAG